MQHILLITLGNSPMIVPEAFLACGVSFDEVHVFTTGKGLLSDHAQNLSGIFSFFLGLF
jgi:hypothetical protein